VEADILNHLRGSREFKTIQVFCEFPGLEKLKVPQSLPKINSMDFDQARLLKELAFPADGRFRENSELHESYSLKRIAPPDSLEIIGDIESRSSGHISELHS
jgi:hypothetical protein